MEVVARSAPDGYTLYICGIGQSIRPAMHKKLPFDTLRDFTRIWLYGAVPNVLVVHPSVPARSVVESGYPGFEVTVWYGLCGPARLPGTVIATLLAGIGKTLAAPDLRRRFARRFQALVLRRSSGNVPMRSRPRADTTRPSVFACSTSR